MPKTDVIGFGAPEALWLKVYGENEWVNLRYLTTLHAVDYGDAEAPWEVRGVSERHGYCFGCYKTEAEAKTVVRKILEVSNAEEATP